MKYPVFCSLLLILFFGSCRQENPLFDSPEPSVTSEVSGADRDACLTGDCNWQIVARGVSPEYSKAVVTVQRIVGNEVVCEQTFQFQPPICNTCWQSVPVVPGSHLRIVANVITEGGVNPNGHVKLYVKRPGSSLSEFVMLGGGGTTVFWSERISCGNELQEQHSTEQVDFN